MKLEIVFRKTSINKIVIECESREEGIEMFKESNYHNHKVVEIEKVEEVVDTYPI
ncbi:hypothetical protein H9S87_18705 (plasmid) [Bacillus pumilus]|uniref:hypothetical protein n=1 Tax=Bacillus pumilus TaxID=1408 RepID=UPI0016586BE3|nr:hypothetical protein [Bacillus pumilus]QNP18315.1 hypothetical protein H9S87_18705 [Bacillus pumilus]